MRPSVYTRIHGGLGNQFFQYSAGRALAIRLGLPLVLDVTWFHTPHPDETPRRYGLDAFKHLAGAVDARQIKELSDQIAMRRFGLVPLAERVALVREPHRHYWPNFTRISGPIYIHGHWQSPRYFEPIAETIVKDLTFPPLEAPAALAVRQQMLDARTAVSLHIRRGDYFSDPREVIRRPACCPPEYYRSAIDILVRRHGPLQLFVFSDEPEWVRTNFDPHGQDMVIVDVPAHMDAAHHDVHLMSLAKHHIIANSTFSWWGAWLGRKAGQSVIAPSQWATHKPNTGMDRFLPSWTTLDGAGREVPLSFS